MACGCEKNMLDIIYDKDCVPYETPILPKRLARAYVPNQKICDLYDPFEALKIGTVFPALKM